MRDLNCFFKKIFSADNGLIFKGGSEKQMPSESIDSTKAPKSGDKWGKDPGAEFAAVCKQEGAKDLAACVDKKRVYTLQASEIIKLDKSKIRQLFLIPKTGKDGKVTYSVDFHSNSDCAGKIGLDDMLGKEVSFVLIQKDSSDQGVFANRGKDGKFYERGTKNPTKIQTGNLVTVPFQNIHSTSGSKW